MKLEQRIKHEAKKWKNFMIGCIALGIFFILPYFHDWANDFIIKLHFCNHTYCFIFSLVFFVFAFVSYDKKKSYIKSALIILVIGIILMNLAVCDAGGKMSVYGFSLGNLGNFVIDDTHSDCTPGVDCAGDIVEVPVPPCVETDSGRDYITFGTILSGADLDDLCMGNTLRERYCNSELTYTSEDIDCLTMYGATWTCEEGECRDTGEVVIADEEEEEEEEEELIVGNETNCGDSLDNDGDGFFDCDDPDCQGVPIEDGGCADFEYSCEHTSPTPECGGTCPTEEVCIYYETGTGGWCECMPDTETFCGGTAPTCGGWCGDDYVCLPSTKGCDCIFDNGNCYDSDGGLDWGVVGYCYDFTTGHIEYDDCASSQVLFEQSCSFYGGCEPYSIICTDDVSFGIYPEMGLECLEEANGGICGSY